MERTILLTAAPALALLHGVEARATPSLRIARFAVTNFRTFHERTEIPLASGGVADEMAVFHGKNGAGKSNALAALDLFFRCLSHWLYYRHHLIRDDWPFAWDSRDTNTGLFLSPRNWPPGVRSAMEIKVDFAESHNPIAIRLVPSGNQVILTADGVWEFLGPKPSGLEDGKSPVGAADEYLSKLANGFETPMGPGSIPLFLLDARRRDIGQVNRGALPPQAPASPLSPALADRLYDLATSLDPGDTERWRSFASLIGRFKTLSGRELTVVKIPNEQGADLRFEIRGKQILRVSELSSGEQQIVALMAAVLTSRAAIVAIEEPEISLHPEYQQLLREVLLEQVQKGLVDQILLESHVPVFDGPEVVRFSRSPEGKTTVERQPSETKSEELRARAKEKGAEEQWVTPEGYTKLPGEMLKNLGLQTGGYLWFLRSKPEGRWEAWKSNELDEMFGFPGDDSNEG